jgi:hypothetical protein
MNTECTTEFPYGHIYTPVRVTEVIPEHAAKVAEATGSLVSECWYVLDENGHTDPFLGGICGSFREVVNFLGWLAEGHEGMFTL